MSNWEPGLKVSKPDAEPSTQFSLAALLRIFASALRRQWRAFLGASVGAFAVLALIVAVAVPVAQYTAEALLILSPSRPFNGNQSQFVDAVSPSAVRDEVEMLKSDALEREVVGQLDLMHDTDFNGPRALVTTNAWKVWPIRQNSTSHDGRTTDAEIKLDRTSARYQGQLEIVADGRSGAIHVRFTTNTPQAAAKTVNKHVETYLKNQAMFRSQRVNQVATALEAELGTARRDLAHAESAVESYRRAMTSERTADNSSEGQLRALEVSAASRRDAYRTVLDAYGAALLNQNVGVPAAQVVLPAVPSWQHKSSKLGVAFGLSLGISVCMGAVLAAFIDLLALRRDRLRHIRRTACVAGSAPVLLAA